MLAILLAHAAAAVVAPALVRRWDRRAFPVLALANPSVPHGKIPLNELNRLKDQRLAVTAEVLKQMARM